MKPYFLTEPPEKYKNQLNGKTAQENYNEIKKKRDKEQRKQEYLKQLNTQADEALDEAVEEFLKQFFS